MIISMKEAMKIAKDKHIAIGAFNGTTSESAIAILEAAEELDVPVILMHAQCHENVAPIDRIGPMMIAMAKASKAKVVVHLDHGEDFDYCKRAIDMGFNSVMIDNSTKQYEDNIKLTKEVVDYAHARNVDVEAELGAMPSRESESNINNKSKDLYTRPELVNDFIDRTGVDTLAIAFGTAHGLYRFRPILNMDIISRIRELSNIPLVMHGGSGISDEEYREVIKRGINKINYYTYMSYAGFKKAKDYCEITDADFYHNLAWDVKDAMKENIIKAMKVFSNMN